MIKTQSSKSDNCNWVAFISYYLHTAAGAGSWNHFDGWIRTYNLDSYRNTPFVINNFFSCSYGNLTLGMCRIFLNVQYCLNDTDISERTRVFHFLFREWGCR